MKRTPLTRKTRLRPRRKGRPCVTAAEKRHLCFVAQLRCVICGSRPVHVHHIKEGADGQNLGMSQRASNFEVIPLCPWHHQYGGLGEGYHSGPRAWVARFGSQRSLLEELLAWMDNPTEPYPHRGGHA